MSSIQTCSWVALIAVLLIGGSCSRRSDEGRAAKSGGSSRTDVNSTSAQYQDESSRPVAKSSVSSEIEMNIDKSTGKTSVTEYSPARSWGSVLDINSGDLHGLLSYSDGHEQYEDYESRLSREVRRLGIPIPAERNWQPLTRVHVGAWGGDGKLVYPDLLHAAQLLLDLLDDAKAADQDRRSILERFMTNMRTEAPRCVVENAHMLIVEFADQYRLASPFIPEYAEHLRQSLKQKAH
jgi:hypothetical protein